MAITSGSNEFEEIANYFAAGHEALVERSTDFYFSLFWHSWRYSNIQIRKKSIVTKKVDKDLKRTKLYRIARIKEGHISFIRELTLKHTAVVTDRRLAKTFTRDEIHENLLMLRECHGSLAKTIYTFEYAFFITEKKHK